MKQLKLTLGIAITLLLSGCATLLDGRGAQMNFNSNVEGVKVLLNGGVIAQTPFYGTIPKPQNGTTQFVFKKKGYETTTITVGRTIAPVAFLNIFWDLGTTDFVTGNAFTYARDSIYVEMEPSDVTGASLQTYKKQAHMRKFVLQNFDDVYVQVQSGEGEYYQHILENITSSEKDIHTHLKTQIDEMDMVAFAQYVSYKVQ